MSLNLFSSPIAFQAVRFRDSQSSSDPEPTIETQVRFKMLRARCIYIYIYICRERNRVMAEDGEAGDKCKSSSVAPFCGLASKCPERYRNWLAGLVVPDGTSSPGTRAPRSAVPDTSNLFLLAPVVCFDCGCSFDQDPVILVLTRGRSDKPEGTRTSRVGPPLGLSLSL